MFRNRVGIKGKVTATVLDAFGKPKRRILHLSSFLNILFGFGYRSLSELKKMLVFEVSINHNIVTDEGDALIADLMASVPVKTKVDGTNGHIQVGTGWTGTTPKTNQVCNTATGSPKIMSSGYPKLKGAFGASNDNVVQYRVVFSAGDLNASGINEAAILNNETPASADCLAYAQITPSVTVSSADSLQIDWEITSLGV